MVESHGLLTGRASDADMVPAVAVTALTAVVVFAAGLVDDAAAVTVVIAVTVKAAGWRTVGDAVTVVTAAMVAAAVPGAARCPRRSGAACPDRHMRT